ncbi:MAG: type II secretion system protein GspM, partial [Woeseiaceae bacterium]
MKAWFESLEERERLFVVAAAIVLAIALFYLAIWMPLDRGQKNLATSIETWRDSLAELRVLKPALGKAGPNRNAPADVSQSLVVIVDNTLRERGLYNSLQRSQPTTTNGI